LHFLETASLTLFGGTKALKREKKAVVYRRSEDSAWRKPALQEYCEEASIVRWTHIIGIPTKLGPLPWGPRRHSKKEDYY